jgi:hypothetical protein
MGNIPGGIGVGGSGVIIFIVSATYNFPKDASILIPIAGVIGGILLILFGIFMIIAKDIPETDKKRG